MPDKPPHRFRIGDWVTFDRVYERIATRDFECEYGREIITHGFSFKAFKEQPIGQIVGARYRHSGVVVWGSGDSGSVFESDGKACLVWLVRLGMLNKPLEVRDEDVELSEHAPQQNAQGAWYATYRSPLPWLYQRPVPWSESQRRAQSEESQSFLRDKHGRFCKSLRTTDLEQSYSGERISDEKPKT